MTPRSASGRAALLTHQSSAEFDNVVASPTPATILYAHDFTTSADRPICGRSRESGLWNNVASGSNRVFAQSSVAGAARAVIGVPTDDQSVDVRARPTTFAGTGGGDRWFGVMARYVDDANYYYLTLRNHEYGVAAQAHQRCHHRARNLCAARHAGHLVPAADSKPWARRYAATSTASWWREATDSTHARGAARTHHQSRRRGFRRLSRHPALNRTRPDGR